MGCDIYMCVGVYCSGVGYGVHTGKGDYCSWWPGSNGLLLIDLLGCDIYVFMGKVVVF